MDFVQLRVYRLLAKEWFISKERILIGICFLFFKFEQHIHRYKIYKLLTLCNKSYFEKCFFLHSDLLHLPWPGKNRSVVWSSINQCPYIFRNSNTNIAFNLWLSLIKREAFLNWSSLWTLTIPYSWIVNEPCVFIL